MNSLKRQITIVIATVLLIVPVSGIGCSANTPESYAVKKDSSANNSQKKSSEEKKSKDTEPEEMPPASDGANSTQDCCQ